MNVPFFLGANEPDPSVLGGKEAWGWALKRGP